MIRVYQTLISMKLTRQTLLKTRRIQKKEKVKVKVTKKTRRRVNERGREKEKSPTTLQ